MSTFEFWLRSGPRSGPASPLTGGKTCDAAVESVKDIDVGGVVGGRERSIGARRPAKGADSWMSIPELWLPVRPVALLLVGSTCKGGVDNIDVGGVVGAREGSIGARRPANGAGPWMSIPERWLPVELVALLLVGSACKGGADANGLVVGGKDCRTGGLGCSKAVGSPIPLSEAWTFAGVGSPLSGQENGNMLLRPNTTAPLSPIKLWRGGAGFL
jgi:hypothetical protein